MSAQPAEGEVKLILLGDSAVGKTKLVERFLMDGYTPAEMSTFALTTFPYRAKRNGREIPVIIWDTAGQERFNNIHPAYYDGAHVCILAFDVESRASYRNLNNWFEELQKYRPHIPCLVAANKIDKDMGVVDKQFSFATKRGINLHYVSAANGTNVVAMFDEAIDLGEKYRENPHLDDAEELIKQELARMEDEEGDMEI